MSSGQRPRPKLVQKLQQRRAAHVRKPLAYRVAFAVAGVVVTLVGVALLVLPGPAFVLIPIGLAMLALEFAWAERALEHALVRADVAKERAASASRAEKVLGGLAAALAIAAV